MQKRDEKNLRRTVFLYSIKLILNFSILETKKAMYLLMPWRPTLHLQKKS